MTGARELLKRSKSKRAETGWMKSVFGSGFSPFIDDAVIAADANAVADVVDEPDDETVSGRFANFASGRLDSLLTYD